MYLPKARGILVPWNEWPTRKRRPIAEVKILKKM